MRFLVVHEFGIKLVLYFAFCILLRLLRVQKREYYAGIWYFVAGLLWHLLYFHVFAERSTGLDPR